MLFSKSDYLKSGKLKPASEKDFIKGWCNIGDTFNVDTQLKTRPNERQIKFFGTKYYNFIHFGINTFTGKEWGSGQDSPSLFNPEKLDTDQWAKVLKQSGSEGVILTAKHHDGFCLWPTKLTDYNISASPYKDGKGDVVAELSESCKKYGLKFGIYLSPWDRHEKTYATDAYNDFYAGQLEELLTGYGEIFMVWLDGARDPKVDVHGWNYDFERYYATINRLQPDCIIANEGPDVRWIGNERAAVRKQEWSVVPKGCDPTLSDLGSRKATAGKETVFYPAEADISLRRGWFWHKWQRPKSVKKLLDVYYRVVGGNATLLLNVPPSPAGLIDEADCAVLKTFGQTLAKQFSHPVKITKIAAGDGNKTVSEAEMFNITKNNDTYYKMKDGQYILDFDFNKTRISRIVLSEYMQRSQRVESYDIYVKKDGAYYHAASRETIGNRAITVFKNPPEAQGVRIVFRQSRNKPCIRYAAFFG